MRIAQIICAFPPYKGGMGNSVYYFSRGLAALGHEITVFTPAYPRRADLPEGDPSDIVVVRLTPLVSSGNAAVMPQLLWRLKGYDAIHLHYPFYGSAGFVALRKLLRPSMRVVLYYHMDTRATGVKGAVFWTYSRVILPVVLRQAERITCSTFDYVVNSDAGGYYKRHPWKFAEVPFGVDNEKFRPGPEHAAGEKVILFVGALIRQNYFKGLENLMLAFKRIRDRINCRLMVVGRGDMEEQYRSLVDELGISAGVDFVTNADDRRLVECYQSCDVMVLPSTDMSEAFGIVLLEAMACAKPVVASDLPGIRSVFEDGKHGLLVAPGDVDDLADKISTLISDEETARRFGKAGRELVEARYTWSRAAEQLDMVYNRVTSKQSQDKNE